MKGRQKIGKESPKNCNERKLKDDMVSANNKVTIEPGLMYLILTRFNECVCTPYNADFDGDEMNLHLPQVVILWLVD